MASLDNLNPCTSAPSTPAPSTSALQCCNAIDCDLHCSVWDHTLPKCDLQHRALSGYTFKYSQLFGQHTHIHGCTAAPITRPLLCTFGSTLSPPLSLSFSLFLSSRNELHKTALYESALQCGVAICAGCNQDMPGSRTNKQIKRLPFVEHLINQPMGERENSFLLK